MSSQKEQDRRRTPKPIPGSLYEAMYQLVLDMSGAQSQEETQEGLARLEALRAELERLEQEPGAAPTTDLRGQLAWLEQRLQRLHRHLRQKQRMFEAPIVEKMAREREEAAISILPPELAELVAQAIRAPWQAGSPMAAPEAGGSSPALSPAAPENAQVQEGSAPESGPDWSRAERLAAHLAGSVQEDPGFFARLCKNARQSGPMLRPQNDREAERHQRALRNLGQRLVNLELHTKALAGGGVPRERLSSLLQAAARELTGFLRDFRACKQELPSLAGEYDRLFGGYVRQFSGMVPEKGQELLTACREERGKEPRKQQSQKEQEPPVLVLRREE